MKRALLLAVLVAGCSFPSVEIVPADVADATDFDASSSDTGEDATEADSTDLDSSDAETETGADTAVVDAKTDSGDDANTDVGVCETGVLCDCDGDGDKKPGAGCGGGDCDDGDGRRSSLVTTFQSYDPAGTGHAGDWNCDMKVETEFTPGTNCGGITLGGSACSGSAGYKEATVACGKKATYVRCKISTGILCVEDSTKTATITVKCK